MPDTATQIEWAVKLAWPDGHVEYRTHASHNPEPYSRRNAELAVDTINADRVEGRTEATAELARRRVVVNAWTPVASVFVTT